MARLLLFVLIALAPPHCFARSGSSSSGLPTHAAPHPDRGGTLRVPSGAGTRQLASDARSHLTPGAIADTNPTIVCAPGYSREHRVWHDQTATLLKYNIPLADRNNYTDDDRVPICLGGNNASPLNHWPEPFAQAEQKDRLEDRLCHAVCAGRMTLPAAQAIFLGDWRSHL